MTSFVTKAMPIDGIDGKCHIKKLKSSRTCLTGYSAFISHEKFFNGLRADTHIRPNVFCGLDSRTGLADSIGHPAYTYKLTLNQIIN